MNEQTENTHVLSAMIHRNQKNWHTMKNQLYHDLIDMAGINDSKLSDCLEDNLEYAMEIILKCGTYAENAKALRMYAQYFGLHNILDF